MSSIRTYGRARLAALLGVIVTLGLVGTALWQRGAVGEEARKETSDKPVHQAQQLSAAFRKAAETAMPSVVTVRAKTKAHTVKGMHPRRGEKGENPLKGTPFEDLFRDGQGFENFGDLQQMIPRREGMGSGVIVDKSGIVLTNNHVVDGADEVIVHLADGREFKGTDIKVDKTTDLAVIHIKGAGSLPVAKLGDSNSLEIGDWVIAIGNPFELEQTVSAGIISAKGRELAGNGPQRAPKYLQTDAAINPGNSGGPLVSLDGEVIGINTAIATNNGGYQGIGFAIPSNTARWVMNQLIKSGSVERAYLGVGIEPIDTDVKARKLGVQRGAGVLVDQVRPNSPAAEAGFQQDDVIVRFGDHKIHSPSELQELVERVPVNSKQQVEILRDGKLETLTVVAKPLPRDEEPANSPRARQREESDSSAYENETLGLEVTDLTSDDAEALGMKNVSGVMIAKVDPNGVAAEQGLRKGMVITKVERKPVHNVGEFKAAMAHETLKEGIMLSVQTTGGNRTVFMQAD